VGTPVVPRAPHSMGRCRRSAGPLKKFRNVRGYVASPGHGRRVKPRDRASPPDFQPAVEVEVNVDYILLLVEKWREARGNGSDIEMTALMNIQRAIGSSITLRNKRDLILAIVDSVNVTADTSEDWRRFVAAKMAEELEDLILAEGLKPGGTRAFVADAFRDGAIPTEGTAVTKILPSVSRFAAGNTHALQKQNVLDKLAAFFDRYFGLA